MYHVSKTVISKAKHPTLHEYLQGYCCLSKNLYNAALFRLRQNFTAKGKEHLSDNELQVQNEISLTLESTTYQRPGRVMSYNFLEKLMRATGNPDFFSGLPMQSAQSCLKDACQDIKSWLSALKTWKQQPEGFTGKPSMPGYRKSPLRNVKFTNQDCVFKSTDLGTMLKLPKTKLTIPMNHIGDDSVLKEVQVVPYYGDFLVITVFETKNIKETDEIMPYSCAIDFGVNNLAAIVSNDGTCLLYKGGAMKAMNQWYNKERARLTGILTKGHKPGTVSLQTKKLFSLSEKRDCFMEDYAHKISSDIIRFCIRHKIGIIVLGKNKGWKQNSSIGKVNNQNFVQIPLDILRKKIAYKAKNAGILVVEQEESYTSKADFLAGNHIPTYGEDDSASFTGKRISRGLYRSQDGTVLNADINGAANILRKAYPDAFDHLHNFDFLQKVSTKGFYDLHVPKCIPVQG